MSLLRLTSEYVEADIQRYHDDFTVRRNNVNTNTADLHVHALFHRLPSCRLVDSEA